LTILFDPRWLQENRVEWKRTFFLNRFFRKSIKESLKIIKKLREIEYSNIFLHLTFNGLKASIFSSSFCGKFLYWLFAFTKIFMIFSGYTRLKTKLFWTEIIF
jgi:hypothetical protein